MIYINIYKWYIYIYHLYIFMFTFMFPLGGGSGGNEFILIHLVWLAAINEFMFVCLLANGNYYSFSALNIYIYIYSFFYIYLLFRSIMAIIKLWISCLSFSFYIPDLYIYKYISLNQTFFCLYSAIQYL